MTIVARGLFHTSAFGVAVDVVVGVAAAAIVIPQPVCLGCQLAVLAAAAIRRAPEHQAHMEWGLNCFIIAFATCFAPAPSDVSCGYCIRAPSGNTNGVFRPVTFVPLNAE